MESYNQTLSEQRIHPAHSDRAANVYGSDTRSAVALKKRAYHAIVRALEKRPRLQRLLWECCSFRHRIRIALSDSARYEMSMGPLYLETPGGQDAFVNTRSLARIRHIRSVAANLPWATPIDWKTHLESWEAGVEWAVGTLGSDSALSDEHKAMLASELSYLPPT